MGAGKTFIQYKGTDLCMDFYCPDCGEHSHFDGMFAYAVKCGACGAEFKMPEDVSSLMERLESGHGLSVLSENDAGKKPLTRGE